MKWGFLGKRDGGYSISFSGHSDCPFEAREGCWDFSDLCLLFLRKEVVGEEAAERSVVE